MTKRLSRRDMFGPIAAMMAVFMRTGADSVAVRVIQSIVPISHLNKPILHALA